MPRTLRRSPIDDVLGRHEAEQRAAKKRGISYLHRVLSKTRTLMACTQGNLRGASVLVLQIWVRTSFMKPLAFIPTGVSFLTASLNMSPGGGIIVVRGAEKEASTLEDRDTNERHSYLHSSGTQNARIAE